MLSSIENSLSKSKLLYHVNNMCEASLLVVEVCQYTDTVYEHFILNSKNLKEWLVDLEVFTYRSAAQYSKILFMYKKLFILPSDGYLWYDAETMVTGTRLLCMCTRCWYRHSKSVWIHSLYKRDVQVPRQCYVHIEGEGLYSVYYVHKQLYFYVVKLETTGTANLMFLDAKYV